VVNTKILYLTIFVLFANEARLISKVLEVTEEVELYLKEMLFIVEHGSEKQAFLLSRKIDKYLHQADNELRTTTSQLNRVTLSLDESSDLLSSIKTFGDVTVNKIIDHGITHKTIKDQQAQFVSDKTTTMSTFKLQNRIEVKGRGIDKIRVIHVMNMNTHVQQMKSH
jgi:hypothetical protein